MGSQHNDTMLLKGAARSTFFLSLFALGYAENCMSITEDPDFTWSGDITQQVHFNNQCTSSAEDKHKCRIRPMSGTQCSKNAHGSVWAKKDDSTKWYKTKQFVCKYDSVEDRFRWSRRSLKRSEKAGLRTVSKATGFGKFTIQCGEPGCKHPKSLFDAGLVDVSEQDIQEPNANINFNRKGTWDCSDSDGNSIENNLAVLPAKSYCYLRCANNMVPELKKAIHCKHTTADTEIGKWDFVNRMYKAINRNYYTTNSKWEDMKFSDGSRDGWRCYTSQPIYGDWSEWSDCVGGEQGRSRTCEGTCKDDQPTAETQAC